MSDSKPTLVIVNGPPAAGKTSIVEQLGAALSLPVFTKDAIKELFADSLGDGARDHASELGEGSQLQLVAIARELLRTGNGVVLESFFHKGVSEPLLAPLVAHSNAVCVHITADEDILVERYDDRMNDLSRHEIHNQNSSAEELRQLLQDGVGDPLEIDCPFIVLDTTNRDYHGDEVAEKVRELLDQGVHPE